MAVRREKVIVELEDRFSPTAATMAGNAQLLERRLQELSRASDQHTTSATNHANALNGQNTALGNQTTTLTALTSATDNHATSVNNLNTVFGNSQNHASILGGNGPGSLNSVGNGANNIGRQFDRASGRVGLLVDALIGIGPAAIPIGAVAAPAVSGLAGMLGIAVAAAGTLVLAFQGVGDAVSAVNAARLDPTVDNLVKANEAIANLGPEATQFVGVLSSMRAEWAGLQRAAAGGFFPQVTKELDEMGPLLERTETLLYAIGQAAGVEVANGIDSLNGDRWEDFFEFLGREAAPTLRDIAATTGSVAHGLAEMWMAFQPLNRDFGDWLVQQAADFDDWAAALEDNQGFQDFVDYIRDNGPRVAETFGAIGGAILDIVQAAAPLGGPVLQILETLADVVGALADSDFGGPLIAGLAAMTLFRRGAQATSALMGSAFVGSIRQTASGVRTLGADWRTATAFGATTTAQITAQQTAAARLRQTLGGLGKGAAIMGGLGIAAAGAANGISLTNTMSLGLMGLIAGPWGAAVGLGVGALMDFSAASDAAGESQLQASDMVEAFRSTLDKQSAALTDATRDQVAFALAQADMGDYAETLGLSMSDLTDLVMASDSAWQSWYQTNGAVSYDAPQEEVDALARFLDGMGEVRGALSTARQQQEDVAAATEESTEAYNLSADALDRLATSFAAWSDLLSGRDALVAFEKSMADLNTTLADGGLNLDRSTEAGLANYEALTAASQATMAWVDTLPAPEKAAGIRYARDQIMDMLTAMGATEVEADAWANSVGLSAQRVEDTVNASSEAVSGLFDAFAALPGDVQTDIRANGIPQTAEAVDALRVKYNLTPSEVDTLMRLQSGAAEAGISRYSGLINALPNEKRVTIRTVYKTEGRPAPGVNMQIAKADGGILSSVGPGRAVIAYASGGLDIANGHLPELTKPGTPMRMWSEPETQGEAYIPLANDWRRPRAISTLLQTAALLGVQQFAGGGIREDTSSYYGRTQSAYAAPAVVVSGGGGGAEFARLQSLVAEQSQLIARQSRALEQLPRRIADATYQAGVDAGSDRAQRINAMAKGGRG